MALILSIETASVNCSVSLFQDNQLIAFREDRSPDYTHGEKLHLFIEDVLKQARILPAQLNAVAVSKGPGSYTGLRIGVSAAKGLCFALGIPLISIPTLLIMARSLPNADGVLIPMLDARRMEVYAAVYDAELNLLQSTWAEVLDINSFAEYRNRGIVHLLGSGAEKCQGLFTDRVFKFHPEILPSSLEMGSLAYEAYSDKKFEDVAYFEPFYLKDFIVTVKKPVN
ncbi:MAG: hypothetical protein RLZZ241_1394 [Bacteroidota bacterium]|jgi:tRNA threonylcarbamoyladenosine biosynthesis protein TsaB